MTHPAVFLDRDNTLIEDPGYLNDPEAVRLFDDTIEALARLRKAGYGLVVVSNQSGLARGLITEEQLDAVHQRLRTLLEDREVRLDGIYFCPYLDGPEATVEAYRKESSLRKPEPGMLLQAADDLGLDLSRSWMIGDAGRDVEAGLRAGCRTILIERDGIDPMARESRPAFVAGSLQEAADIVLEQDHQTSGPSETASPASEPSDRKDVELTGILGELRDLLDRSVRRRRQEDFSVMRLAGTLLQLLAVVAGLWGVYALFAGGVTDAVARLLLAVFLQLVTLTLAIGERRD